MPGDSRRFARQMWDDLGEAFNVISMSKLRIGRSSRPIDVVAGPGRLVLFTDYSGDEGDDLLGILSGVRRPFGGSVEVNGSEPGFARGLPGAVFLTRATSLDPARAPLRQLAARLAIHGCGSRRDRAALVDWMTANGLEKESVTRTRSLARWMPGFMEFSIPDIAGPPVLAVCDPLASMPSSWSDRVIGILSDLKGRGCAIVVAAPNPLGLCGIADEIARVEE